MRKKSWLKEPTAWFHIHSMEQCSAGAAGNGLHKRTYMLHRSAGYLATSRSLHGAGNKSQQGASGDLLSAEHGRLKQIHDHKNQIWTLGQDPDQTESKMSDMNFIPPSPSLLISVTNKNKLIALATLSCDSKRPENPNKVTPTSRRD